MSEDPAKNYAKTKTLTNDDIEKISENPKNIMYEYQHDTVDRVKASDEIKYLMIETMECYKKVREKTPEVCDNACRRELTEKSPQLKDFQKTHPKIFGAITNRKATARDFEVIYFQLNMVKKIELGEMTYETGYQQATMDSMEKCKTGMSYEEYQKQQNDLI